jgi:hypothetical protein
MKKILFVVVLFAASFAANAQGDVLGLKFGLGANLAIPLTNYSDSYSIGAGIDLLGQYGISEQVAVTVDAGYTSLFGKKLPNGIKNDLSIIPIRAGLRFYPAPEFYIAGKAGIGIIKPEGFSSTNTTAYSFGIGYFVNPTFDVSASYDGYSKNGSSSLINIRLGYTFSH